MGRFHNLGWDFFAETLAMVFGVVRWTLALWKNTTVLVYSTLPR